MNLIPKSLNSLIIEPFARKDRSGTQKLRLTKKHSADKVYWLVS